MPDKGDGRRIGRDRVDGGCAAPGFEGDCAKGFTAREQDGLKRLGAGELGTGLDHPDWAVRAAHLAPVGDLPGIDRADLVQCQLGDRVRRMADNGDGIMGQNVQTVARRKPGARGQARHERQVSRTRGQGIQGIGPGRKNDVARGQRQAVTDPRQRFGCCHAVQQSGETEVRTGHRRCGRIRRFGNGRFFWWRRRRWPGGHRPGGFDARDFCGPGFRVRGLGDGCGAGCALAGHPGGVDAQRTQRAFKDIGTIAQRRDLAGQDEIAVNRPQGDRLGRKSRSGQHRTGKGDATASSAFDPGQKSGHMRLREGCSCRAGRRQG